MSNVSVFGKKWIDLVFEGKNKEYGAYKLRQENPRTTLKAMFLGVLFFASIGGLGMIFSSFAEKPIPTPPEPLGPDVVVSYHKDPEPEKPAEPVAPKKIIPPSNDDEGAVLRDPVIVTADDEPDNIKPNNDPPADPDPSISGTIGGISTDGSATATTAPIGTATGNASPDVIHRRGALDKLPQYPGGITKFNRYISNNFEKPVLDNSKKLTVYVSFVIEKDGTISNIKVLENPGHGLDNEAIRVLKSLRTKWAPGIKDGQKVRTLFTLPITVVTD